LGRYFQRGCAVAVLIATCGCTTIHAVGGGAAPGEFYVVTNKNYLLWQTPPRVLRCENAGTSGPHCVQVLTSDQADHADISPSERAFETCRRAGVADGGFSVGYDSHPPVPPRVDEVIQLNGIAAQDMDACRSGYATGYGPGQM